jgi:aminoglycoside phosphotransferase (APT) family kinase protein
MLSGPDKWREAKIDPLTIPLSNELSISTIVGYPHAGNDVFACLGLWRDKETEFYLKIGRHIDADLSNEAAVLKEMLLYGLPVPEVYSQGVHAGYEYLVLSAMPGYRLSYLLRGDQSEHYKKSLPIMLQEMGALLGHIHSLPLEWRPVPRRRQHSIPEIAAENPLGKEMSEIVGWLGRNVPPQTKPIFIHGDFHYANVLWEKDNISAILDWELAGIGWREFDLAWATILRPSQNFMKKESEVEEFLKGYCQTAEYDGRALKWCQKLIYCHFLNMKSNWDDAEYLDAAMIAARH